MKFHEKYFKRFDLIVINNIPGKKLVKLKKLKKKCPKYCENVICLL